MDEREAIERIKVHNQIHFEKEYPKAIKITKALDMAVDALEKQIAKKPIRKYGNYNCPICDKSTMSVSARKKDWCDFCGQKLDWELEK